MPGHAMPFHVLSLFDACGPLNYSIYISAPNSENFHIFYSDQFFLSPFGQRAPPVTSFTQREIHRNITYIHTSTYVHTYVHTDTIMHMIIFSSMKIHIFRPNGGGRCIFRLCDCYFVCLCLLLLFFFNALDCVLNANSFFR